MAEYVIRGKVLKPDTTEITISKEYPYSYLTRDLPGNQMEVDDETLIKKVLELVVIEIDTTGILYKVQEAVKETRLNVKKTEDNAKVASDALVELTTTVYELSSEFEEMKEHQEALMAQVEALTGKKTEGEEHESYGEHEEIHEEPHTEATSDTGENGGGNHD